MYFNKNSSATYLAKFLVIAFLFFSFKAKHPFYLSVSDLKYNAREKTMQAAVKLFTNDLEEALKKIYAKPVDLINGKDKQTINKLLADYIQKHFVLKVDSKAINFDLIGFEREEEAVWVYIEFKNCPPPKKVEIENSLLYDFIPSQINIVNLDVEGIKKSSKVTNPEKKLFFDF